MKEVFKRIIFTTLFCVFWTPCVLAISEDCGNKEFWDPWDWTATVRSPGYGANPKENLLDFSGSMPRNFVYNITNIGMYGGDTLTIQGWAFTTGTTSVCTNSSVSFKLVSDGGGKEYEFQDGTVNNVWTNETNFMYWTCARTPYQPGITAGRCRTGSESHLSGSFSKSIDLGQLKEEKTYTVMMKYNGIGDIGWFKVAVGLDVSGDLTSYKGNGSMNISIDGFANKIEAVGYNRALGPSGTYCDAPGSSLEAKANNTLSGTYPLAGAARQANKTSGGMKIYPVSVSGGTAYIPAISSRLISDNGLRIKVTKGEDAEYDVVDPPEACEGGEVYIFHYFFLDELYGRTVDRHTGADASYGDIYAISEVLNASSLSELIIGDGSYVTIKDGTGKYSLNWFHDGYKKASNAAHRYYQSGNEFFIDKETWIDYDHGGSIQEAPIYSMSYEDLRKKAVQADVTINRRENDANNGFLFDLSRDYKSNTASGKKLISPWGKSAGGSVSGANDLLYQPAVYTLSLCKKPKDVPAQCPDTVKPAVCSSGDEGTHVVFHENKDVKTCTLPAGNHSGFTIVDETDNNYSHKTTSPAGTVFGRVACKEDLDIYLPTSKYTASGQYFLLDNDAGYDNPHIKAVRTCATSPVKYADLDKDLKNNYEQPTQLELLYNVYRDHLFVWNNFPGGPETEDKTGSCIGSDKKVYKYSYTDWKIPNDGITIGDTPNHKYGYTEAKGTYIPSIPPMCNLKSSDTPQAEWKKAKDAEESKTWAAKAAYDGMLYNYHETVLAYNAMFNWEDKTLNTNYHSEGSIQNAAWIDTKQGHVDTTYKFKPKVTFNYPDRDGSVFPVEYEYPITQQSPSTNKGYWGEGAEPDNEYKSPNGGYDVRPRQLTNCRDGGEKCVPLNITGQFHHNGALKREETIEYDYNLPTVYTIVPHGRVTTTEPNRAHLTLDPEAVPVNINTVAGTYEYTISITELKDEVRQKYYNVKQNNPDDNWAESPPASSQTRFVQRKVLNAGQEYVCNYEVVNDIYIPVNPNEHFNFFYRIIDTEDINPNNRTLGYNWADGRGNVVQDLMIRNEQSYQRLTNSPDVDKFVFTLTPVLMKQIRTYNATRSYNDGYADWDLNCLDYDSNGGYHCYSNFLNCLTGGTGESGQVSCSQIFGSSFATAIDTEFESKKSNYTLHDLQTNRSILINKQNGIDGRGGTAP